MPIIVLIIYGVACTLCGIMGRNTTIGFIGHFLVAAVTTPVTDFLIQAIGRPSVIVREKMRMLKSR